MHSERRLYREFPLTAGATDSSSTQVTGNCEMKSRSERQTVDYAVNWKRYAVN